VTSNRLSPGNIWKSAAFVWLAAFVVIGGSRLNWWHATHHQIRLVFALIDALAYGVAAILCLRIADEHRDSPKMRQAWMMLTVSAFFSAIRHAALAAISIRTADGPDSLAGHITAQGFMVLSLVFLTAGLFYIWRAFSALQLGFSLHPIDIVMFVSIVVLVPPIIISSSFSLPSSYNILVPAFRYAGAILLPVSAVMGILLYRIAVQMRGGELARSLRMLVIFAVGRLLMSMLNALPALRANPTVSTLDQVIMQGIPFLFTLAAAYRWQITQNARIAMAEREIGVLAM